MKGKHIAIALVAVVAAAATASGWGSLVSSFRCPGSSLYPNGVGWMEGYLFLTMNQPSPDPHYRTTYTGSVVRYHALPTSTTRGCAAGRISGTGYYWVANNSPARIYRIGYDNGSIYHSFTPAFTSPYGLAYRQSGSYYYLYGVSSSGRRLYRMDALTGSVYDSYALSFQPNGVGYGGGYLWFADGGTRTVYKCSTTGSVYDSFSVSSYGYAAGCDFDGTYVWVGINSPLHSCLRFEVSGTGIKPDSMGKIKAMFR